MGVIGAVALGLRLAFVWSVGDATGYVGGDQTTYVTLAREVRHGYPTVMRMPGYPVFVALILHVRDRFGLAGSDRVAVGVGQAILGTMTVITTGALGRRIHRPSTGLIAAGLVAVWPSLVVMTSVMLTETLFTALLVGALAVLFWRDEPTKADVAITGLLLGAAYLVRFVAFAPLLAAAVWVVRCYGRRSWPWIWRLGIGAAALMAPWAVRNAVQFRAFVPADVSGGYSWCMGNHDGARPDQGDNTGCIEQRERESAVEQDRRLTRRAWAWIAEHPGTYAGMVPERTGFLLADDDDGVFELNGRVPAAVHWQPDDLADVRRVVNGWWRILRWPALWGAVLMAQRRRLRWPMIVALSVMLPPLFVVVAPRYHVPVIPIMAIAISVAVGEATGRFRAFRDRRLTPDPVLPA